MTWRDSALWEMRSAFAAAVKLACFATASKARSALSGSQRRSIRPLSMIGLLEKSRVAQRSGARRPSAF
jgi:hypothetical protein